MPSAKRSSTSKTSTSKKSAGGQSRLAMLWRSLYQPRRLFWLAAAVTLVALGPRLSRCLPDLSERDEYRVRTAAIRILERPEWVPHDLIEQVAEQAQLPPELSLLDASLTRRIAEAFLQNPWVTGVRVKKSVPAGIEVELQYRRPVAMVEVATGLYPVDAEGVLLPPADFSAADAPRFPLIRNIRTLPQGAAGQDWGDPAVTAAARLARVLLPRWREFHLASINVPLHMPPGATADDLLLELCTAGGSRILWGRAPGTSHPGELTVEQKLGRLEDYRTRYGGFDHAHGPYEIDIRHWQEISRRPLEGRNF